MLRKEENAARKTYVLVHGGDLSTDTWNQLVQRKEYPDGEKLGGKVWDKVSAVLKEKGHTVFTPTLGDENICSLSDHVNQVCELIVQQNLQNVILVGHSYGGLVITGIAEQMKGRIAHLVYLDAAFSEPGQSLFDILKLGGLNPVDVAGGSPKAYTEKLIYHPEIIRSLQKTFIFCKESEFAPLLRLFIESEITPGPGRKDWNYKELPTHHVPQASMPIELAKILLEIA